MYTLEVLNFMVYFFKFCVTFVIVIKKSRTFFRFDVVGNMENCSA